MCWRRVVEVGRTVVEEGFAGERVVVECGKTIELVAVEVEAAVA